MKNQLLAAMNDPGRVPETGLDSLPPRDALSAMLTGQIAALEVIGDALSEIEAAAQSMANTLRHGGCVVYAAAGSSGLMALADAAELPGTFGIAPEQIRIEMAGGVPRDARMPGGTEDDTAAAAAVVAALDPGDLVIALSASGTTPFSCAVAEEARTRGIRVVAIANIAGSRLLGLADVAICLPTPPELLAGSTRLGAGTAQKVALNMMSTLAGVILGHVHAGRMVNLRADNAKLRARAVRIVAEIAGVSDGAAGDALDRCGGDAKPAILVAKGASAATGRALLVRHGGQLGAALAALGQAAI